MAAALASLWSRCKSKTYAVKRAAVKQDDAEEESNVETEDGESLKKLTVEEAIDRVGCGFFQILVISFAGALWMVEAVEVILLSLLASQLACEWGLSSVEQATLTSMVFVGYQLGAPFWGYLADRYGRKRTLVTVSFSSAFFALLSAFSPSFGWMIFLRTMLGVTSSGATQGVTLCVEYLPKKSRAVSIMLLSTYWVAGAVAMVALGWVSAPLGWRWMVGLAAVPFIVVTVASPMVPRSARFLFLRGQKAAALHSLGLAARVNCRPRLNIDLISREDREEHLKEEDREMKQKLRQHLSPQPSGIPPSEPPQEERSDALENCDPSPLERDSTSIEVTVIPPSQGLSQNSSLSDSDHSAANGELPDRANNSLKGKSPSSWKQMLKGLTVFQLFKDGLWKTTLPLFLIWIGVVTYYFGIILVTTVIFQYDRHCSLSGCADVELDRCRVLTNEDYSALMWTTVAEFPGCVLTAILVPFFGRKPIMVVEMALTAIFSALLFVCASRTVLIVIIFCCRGLISAVYQMLFIYTPEVYPTSVRALGLALCTTAGRIGSMSSPFIAQVLFQASDIGGILVYLLIAVMVTVLLLLLPIETKGRELKES